MGFREGQLAAQLYPDTPSAETETETEATTEHGQTATEGFDESIYSAEVVGDYRAAVADLGIDNDHAQQLLERVAPKLAERQAETLRTLRGQWVEQARTDAELSAHGFDNNIRTARGVLRDFGSDELGELLTQSGLGDHPALIRFALRIGRRLGRAL